MNRHNSNQPSHSLLGAGKRWTRRLGLVVLPLTLVFIWSCIQRPMLVPTPDADSTQYLLMSQSAERDVDILFLVDSSGSMENEQENLRVQFVSLMNQLKEMDKGLPNVHIGVITPDLGTGNITDIDGCRRFLGDDGVIGRAGGVERGEICIGAGQRYIVDVEPLGCTIERQEDVQKACLSHDCVQAQCEAAAGPGEVLTLVEDENGCPRCRNYGSVHSTLEDTFKCLADVGHEGCGFEQQLEAVRKALSEDETPENVGFLRESAFLSLILITDEDDCSAAKPETLFNSDASMNTIDSQLGYLHSFRCFEFGVTCDISDRTVTGPRNECTPNDDPHSLLHGIHRYTSFLEGLRDPSMLIVGSISGPVEDQVMVTMQATGQGGSRPTVGFSCKDPSQPDEGAKPGIRLREFVGHFNDAEDMGSWAYTSVCNADFTPALVGLGMRIRKAMETNCPASPFTGCAAGPAGTSCSPCLPECVVYDIERKGDTEQRRREMPWCGHVCTGGLCTQADLQPCDYDENGKCHCTAPLYPTKLVGQEGCAPLLYPNAQADYDRDERLADLVPAVEPLCVGPDCNDGTEGRASACWFLAETPACGAANAGFKVVRADDPPRRTFSEAWCKILPETETFCHDGVDNDGDCKVDMDDEDCRDDSSGDPPKDPGDPSATN